MSIKKIYNLAQKFKKYSIEEESEEESEEEREEFKPLSWSVDWRYIMNQILVTYPIKKTQSGWVVSNNDKNAFSHGESFATPSKAKAVNQAVDWFIEKLLVVANSSEYQE